MAQNEFHKSLINRTTADQRNAATSKRVKGQKRLFKVYLDAGSAVGKYSYSVHAANIYVAIHWACQAMRTHFGKIRSLKLISSYQDVPGKRRFIIRGYNKDYEGMLIARIYHMSSGNRGKKTL